MLSQQDVVDNFFMFTNSLPTDLYPNNNHNTFSVSFPHRRDILVNEAWEVAVTSLTIPYWATNPHSNIFSNWIKLDMALHVDEDEDEDFDENKVTKIIYMDQGYFTSRRDYIKSIILRQPLFVFMDESDQSIHRVDIDDCFEWRFIQSSDSFILDTSAFFDRYDTGRIDLAFGAVVQKAVQAKRSRNRLRPKIPFDHRIRTGERPVERNREGYYYRHKNHVLVHSNLIGSSENPQKILFHSSEINKPANHTQYATVNLVPEQLEYHKVAINTFSDLNFKITDLNGDVFDWLHNTPVSIGLHFRKRYYINVYK